MTGDVVYIRGLRAGAKTASCGTLYQGGVMDWAYRGALRFVFAAMVCAPLALPAAISAAPASPTVAVSGVQVTQDDTLVHASAQVTVTVAPSVGGMYYIYRSNSGFRSSPPEIDSDGTPSDSSSDGLETWGATDPDQPTIETLSIDGELDGATTYITAFLFVPGSGWSAEATGSVTMPNSSGFPGMPIPASNSNRSFDQYRTQMWRVELSAGAVFAAALRPQGIIDGGLDVTLFGPAPTPTAAHPQLVKATSGFLHYWTTIRYRVPAAGTYYVRARAIRAPKTRGGDYPDGYTMWWWHGPERHITLRFKKVWLIRRPHMSTLMGVQGEASPVNAFDTTMGSATNGTVQILKGKKWVGVGGFGVWADSPIVRKYGNIERNLISLWEQPAKVSKGLPNKVKMRLYQPADELCSEAYSNVLTLNKSSRAKGPW